MMKMINELWNNISDFETHEVNNDSTNPILANARQGARMEAYTKLMDNAIQKYSSVQERNN